VGSIPAQKKKKTKKKKKRSWPSSLQAVSSEHQKAGKGNENWACCLEIIPIIQDQHP
jgi:hypothetical protein